MKQFYKMYVANCTQQVQDFVYRVPGQSAPRRQPIQIGEQIKLSGDLEEADVNYIISQHAKYGMIRVDEIDRTRTFIGLCYDIDKPVPGKRILIAIEHNQEVLTARGEQIRKESAVALSNYTEARLQDSRLPGTIREVEVSVTEQETASNPNPTFARGVRVSRDSEPPKGGRRRRAA